MRRLSVTSNRIGDAVLSTLLLDYPIRTSLQAAVTVVRVPAAEGVFARTPNLARLITMEKRPRGLHRVACGRRWRGFRGTWRRTFAPRPFRFPWQHAGAR